MNVQYLRAVSPAIGSYDDTVCFLFGRDVEKREKHLEYNHHLKSDALFRYLIPVLEGDLGGDLRGRWREPQN